jgi:hypothetical protein
MLRLGRTLVVMMLSVIGVWGWTPGVLVAGFSPR